MPPRNVAQSWIQRENWQFETHTVVSKLDQGYDDYVSGKISDDFWERKSQEWEAELQTVEAERGRQMQPKPCAMATAAQILELAKQAEFLYKTPGAPARYTGTPVAAPAS